MNDSYDEMIEKEREDLTLTNEKITKLMVAVKSRIIEMQIEDRENSLADHFSNVYAIATKVVANDEV
jgi:hypothetical protein